MLQNAFLISIEMILYCSPSINIVTYVSIIHYMGIVLNVEHTTAWNKPY